MKTKKDKQGTRSHNMANQFRSRGYYSNTMLSAPSYVNFPVQMRTCSEHIKALHSLKIKKEFHIHQAFNIHVSKAATKNKMIKFILIFY